MSKTLLAAGAFAAAAAFAAAPAIAAVPAFHTYTAVLRGGDEVGGGRPDASGLARISIANDYSKVCYELSDLRHVGMIKGVDIQAGALASNGPAVLRLKENGDEVYAGCASSAASTGKMMQANPQDFYVNVHTLDFPGGALRGQLSG